MGESAPGRMDDDGTVYVRMPDGSERSIGQWAAGDPQAGLAYFTRRYQDLIVELDLMRTRLKKGQAKPDDAVALADRIKLAVTEPTFLGDLPALSAKADQLIELAGIRKTELAEEKQQARADASSRRNKIAEEAEALANSQQWKSTGQKFRQLLDEWKALPRFDKASEQKQWERFRAARSAFDKARRQHFAQLDEQRAEAIVVKDDIIRRAQALSSSTDWATTARAYRDLMTEWKAAPRANRDQEDRLWQEFRAAQDTFFDARKAVFSERDDEEKKNLEAKEAILAKVDALFPVSDPQAARRKLSELMDQWDQIGYVPRDAKGKIEKRLRAAERKIRDSEQERWKRTDPAARALAESTTNTFRTSVAKREEELAAAEESGDIGAVAKATSALESARALLAAAEGALSEYSQD
ncbi:MAG: hypothetical protein CMH41_01760 [Micrococcales bacterium]|nr:hypothetical protein [Micrococcales bacterium]